MEITEGGYHSSPKEGEGVSRKLAQTGGDKREVESTSTSGGEKVVHLGRGAQKVIAERGAVASESMGGEASAKNLQYISIKTENHQRHHHHIKPTLRKHNIPTHSRSYTRPRPKGLARVISGDMHCTARCLVIAYRKTF